MHIWCIQYHYDIDCVFAVPFSSFYCIIELWCLSRHYWRPTEYISIFRWFCCILFQHFQLLHFSFITLFQTQALFFTITFLYSKFALKTQGSIIICIIACLHLLSFLAIPTENTTRQRSNYYNFYTRSAVKIIYLY